MKLDNIYSNDLHTLLAKMLMGQLSADEQAYLDQLLKENPHLRVQVERMVDDNRLASLYRQYQSIDVERAKARFIEKYLSGEEKSLDVDGTEAKGSVELRYRIRPLHKYIAAAVVACVVVFSGWLLLEDHDSEATQSLLTAELSHSIDRLEQNGMNGATLTIDGKAVAVNNAQDVLAHSTAHGEYAENGEHAANSALPSQAESSDIVSEGTLSTRHDKEFWMVLDDGTYVHLNYDSKLIYPTRFVEDERAVTLIGEAYFVVAKDRKDRPFIVHTPRGDVRDYGTEFNVNTKTENGTTSVILVKGKVGVTCRGGREIALQPGDMAMMGKERLPLVSKVDVTPYVSWNTGNFYFDGISLQELMRVIGHWYNMDVAYADDAMRDIRFTGTLEKYESLHNTLHAIENVIKTPISTGEGVILIGK